MTEDTTDKPRRGWQPGQSGNPAGRPPGSDLTQMRRALAQRLPEVLDKLIAQALAGNVNAARALLERGMPPLKAEAVAVSLPELAAASGLVARAEVLVKAVAEGVIAPDTAAMLIAALNGQSRLIEIEELERRIAALEDPHGLV